MTSYYQHLATVGTCNLNQHALDFDGNLQRLKEVILEAKKKGCRYVLTPELAVSGYSCEDHFLEVDTYRHSMECLAELLKGDLTKDILCDIGIPVLFKNVRYNCRAFLLNGKLLLLRPKVFMANDGNYRELRWFIPWTKRRQLETMIMPEVIRNVTGQKEVPFGDGVIQTLDTVVGTETCEELFTPKAPHVQLALDGVEIIGNGSGSHHTLRKLNTRVELIQNATKKSGGCYLYSNQQGCDGTRLYFDGSSMISLNGDMLKIGSQFGVSDVELVAATIDLDQIRSYRMVAQSRSIQASFQPKFPRVHVEWKLCSEKISLPPALPKPVEYLTFQQEIAQGPAMWLWDYLRRSKQAGFFLPLSGGADSASTAAIVGNMCQMVFASIKNGNKLALKDCQFACGQKEDWVPKDPKEIAGKIFHTCYMGTKNSGETTRKLAKDLAAEIGAYHLDVKIDIVVDAMFKLFQVITGKTPKFSANGGSWCEDIALQNIQARLRMVLSYFLAQTLDWVRGGRGRSLLVLGSANVGEALRGYYTKYDCSSADINPIGGISKNDLKAFLHWGGDNLGYPTLKKIVAAPPTAELKPLKEGEVTQTDEADMGMTYNELTYYGKLRKIYGCGPVSMFLRLSHEWSDLGLEEVARKVMHFFHYYAINRHKMTILTPAYHAENYSVDDNRYDLRPFLYPNWSWQRRKIQELVEAGKLKTKV